MNKPAPSGGSAPAPGLLCRGPAAPDNGCARCHGLPRPSVRPGQPAI